MARPKADPDAVSAARRKAQADHFNSEYRALMGHRPKVEGVSDATEQQSMRAAFDEAARLAAVHDPAKPSACRLCGRSVQPGAEGAREVAGWKCCPVCVALLPGGLAAVLSDVLGVAVEPGEVDEVAVRTRLGNPSYFLDGWANRPGEATRWAHVDPSLTAGVVAMLAEIRGRHIPRPNTHGTGCCWCGVRTSVRWTTTPFRAGRDPGTPRFAACATCEPWIARSGVRSEEVGDWRPHLLACCTGMRRGRMGVTFGLKAFFEVPGDHSGCEEPWQYLGTLHGELRARVIRQYPSSVTLTDREQRVLAMERQVAAAGRAVPRTPLADLGDRTATGGDVMALPPGQRLAL